MSSRAEEAWLLEAAGGTVLEFYSALGIDLKDRGGEEAAVRCFANPAMHSHEDRKASCSVNLATGLWHCKGCGESGNAYRAALVSGQSEDQARELAQQHGLFLEVVKDKKKPRLPTEVQARKWRRAMRVNAPVLRRLEVLKGWTPYGIQQLGVGWDGERIVFVIRNAKYKIVGYVRYLPGGKPKTLALPGSKRDLFPPPESIHRRYPLYVVEGEGDAVAIWSLGLRAVAIPGAGSWRREWGLRFAGRKIVILADCDDQGRGLAQRVAADTSSPWVDIEPGRNGGHDVGAMICEAAAEGGVWQVRRTLEALV